MCYKHPKVSVYLSCFQSKNKRKVEAHAEHRILLNRQRKRIQLLKEEGEKGKRERKEPGEKEVQKPRREKTWPTASCCMEFPFKGQEI